ncbi:Uncharacterised protein [Vibrio cholerae]|nr:Uncharacterised protein [Vibrio cholerae]
MQMRIMAARVILSIVNCCMYLVPYIVIYP